MNIKKIALFAIVLMLVTACQPARPSVEQLAATIVAEHAETAAAAKGGATAVPIVTAVPVATQTPAPPDAPLPSPAITETAGPTLTQPAVIAETAAPTLTQPPTVTEAAAPTLPHPPSAALVVKDDFSVKSDIWEKCDKCEWKDGKLYLGPFDPKGDGINQLFPLVCAACGEHTYFRIAADVTFASGVAGDRFYGLGGVIPEKFYAGSSMTPYQFGCLEVYNYETKKWSGSGVERYGAIKPSTATNHVEFVVKPTASGSINYYEIVNGKTIIILQGREGLSLKPALYVAWHSVGVTFDNFEFEEIIP